MAENDRSGVRLTPVDYDPFAPPPAVTVLPLTEAQGEMWAALQMGPEASCSYNQCFPLRLRGALDVDALRRALNQVVQRHAALRATFDAEGRQRIHETVSVDLPLVDLARRSSPESARAVHHILETESRVPFDLGTGPSIRAQLIREEEDVHTLVVTAHHIVCDGWSSGTLLADLGALYSAQVTGMAAALPAAASYVDYIRETAAPAAERERRAAEEYWLGCYADAVPELDLPADHPRPPVKTYPGAQDNRDVEASLYPALKRLGARHGCTSFVTLLAGFQALVHRLTGQTDFVIGIPFAGQAALENGHLVGHCVQTLPLRCRVDPESSFAEHLVAVRTALLDAQTHRALTFGTLVRRLKLPRDPSRTPLVGIIFNVDRMGALPTFARLAVEPIVPPKSFVNFELSLNLVDADGRLVIESSYNTDLFEPETIRRWMGHFVVLLEGAAADPKTAIADLPVLSDRERQGVLVGWNQTGAPLPAEPAMHRLFEAQVRRTPAATAVVDGITRLTYEQLNRQANRIARRLRALGVRPENLVGVCLERSANMLAALLGVLKAGGAYLPLDPAYPRDRFEFMLADAGAVLLITQESLRPRVAGGGTSVLSLDGDGEALEQEGDTDLDGDAGGPSLAYVIYTSGSTGRPKGVAIEHGNAVALIGWAGSVYSASELSGVLAATSICFDLSVFEMFVPLSLGGKVVVADSALELPRIAAADEVTLVNTVPSVMAELLRGGALPLSVVTVNLAGEPLPTQLVDRLYEQPGVTKVYDLYGPTEDTTYSTFTLRRSGEPPTIGRSISNSQAYVLDGRRRPVPIGVVGELYLGGAGVARGYLNRPELTEERFVPDLFSADPGARMYRTGDLARWRADGCLEYLGRSDHQVKLRGFRIELGEIEAALALHPAVREVAVLVRQDGDDEQRLLVAYVATDLASAATVLRDHLRTRLPEFMVPAHFVVVASLGRTVNGKVDRQALPAPSRPDPRPVSTPPRNPAEEVVARIWREILRRPEVDIQDNFFELGGDSLMAARMMNRLQSAFGVHLPLRRLFEARTLAALAELADAARWVPRELIRALHPGDGTAVMDPFCGSGTTLVEAALAGLPAVGVDLHPLACLISKVKVTPLAASLADAAEATLRRARTADDTPPSIPALDHWFKPEIQRTLAALTRAIDEEGDADVRDALRVALSSIIVRVSNQESDTRYAAIAKDVSAAAVWSGFRDSACVIEQALGATWGGLLARTPAVTILNRDVLEVRREDVRIPVSLVVTSPPYPNAYEYWLYHKYRMFWLGMDPIAVREREIGARPHYFKRQPQTADDFERQMTTVFSLLWQLLVPGGHVCFQVGNSIIRGEAVDNAALVTRAAERSGFRPVMSAARRIPATRKAFNPRNSRIHDEQVLVFAREDRDERE